VAVPVSLPERRRKRRTLLIILTAAILAAVFVFLTGPPTFVPTTAISRVDSPAVRGAFHIHTTRSDGALDKAAIAAAAARAGLQFAIFTDHGDATRAPDAPQYLDGVLCLDAVEISTNGGHYIALGMGTAPYRLGGEADDVAEDVRRLGGFGLVAHPSSARAELAWADWTVRIDGLEWLNADSEWRDESRLRLTRAFLDYLWRPAGALASLLDRPADTLGHWDQLAAKRRVVALAGHDAHGGLGAESGGRSGRRLHVPSYESSFSTFSVYATLERGLTADPVQDAALLLGAIREGRVFTAIDALAAPASFEFTGDVGGTIVRAGQAMPASGGPARFTVHATVPPGAVTTLLRDGRGIVQANGGELEHTAALPGVYRVEVHIPRAPGIPPVPWLVSNPIYRWQAPPSIEAAPPLKTISRHALIGGSWRVEASPGSSGRVTADSESVGLQYELRGGAEASQFVALATDVRGLAGDADVIELDGRASKPIRLSVQLRFNEAAESRWGRSIYLDQNERQVQIPLGRLRPSGSSGIRPPLSRATSALFVVDLTNTSPGSEGGFTLRNVRLAHEER
jgi:hypothetical protein